MQEGPSCVAGVVGEPPVCVTSCPSYTCHRDCVNSGFVLIQFHSDHHLGVRKLRLVSARLLLDCCRDGTNLDLGMVLTKMG